MKSQPVTKILGVILTAMVVLLCGYATRALAQAPDPNAQSGVEVLTRGPVHEAYAEPITYTPTQGAVVSKSPPAVIEEVPPEDKPQGDNVEWIPGYWSWDVDRSDFIWVSGIWRDPPPDRSWVPGYWTQVGKGWVWTPGVWTAAESEEVEYLPAPPASLEVGPSSPAPAADRLWTPGCWVWSDSRYAWRPGYWVTANPDWVWEPSHYVWTPRGYIYNDGYWDRTLDRRGVLFAPISIQASVYSQSGYSYTPSIVIEAGFLTAALFDFPDSNHYYFGDYYGPEYSRRGFHPWFEPDQRHRDYDPIYSQQRWQYGRTDTQWEQNVRADYNYRQQHVEARPARTYSAQAAAAARAPEQYRKNMLLAAPLSQISTRQGAPIPFKKIDAAGRQSHVAKAKDLVKYRDERVKWEAKPVQAAKVEPAKGQVKGSQGPRQAPKEMVGGNRPKQETKQAQGSVKQSQGQPKGKAGVTQPVSAMPERVKIPKSPIVGRHVDTPGQGGNPPGRPEAPKPDPNIRPNSGGKDSSKHEAPAAGANAPSGGGNQAKGNQGKGNEGGKH